MRTVALLLEDPKNLYQQLLVREARASAAEQGVRLLDAEFAGGSSWNQVETLNGLLRSKERPDALLVVLAGGQPMKGTFERVAKAGLPLVLLNRVPDWIEELRTRFPDALLAGVAPDQAAIGRIQAQQATRLAKKNALLMLVTGTAAATAAVERKQAFLEGVKDRYTIHEIDGGWSAEGADKALVAWFRVGADRERVPELVVCQNDAMAEGARAALRRQATVSGVDDFGRVPLIGCDGLADEGCARVKRGELAATVILPPTTPTALQLLGRYWDSGVRPGTVLLDVTSFPAIDALRAA